jgi:hypothetical protein
VLYDTGHVPETWSQFSHCISANNLRGHDFKHTFQKKYPLGTIHLLLALLGSTREIAISIDAIAPLLYTDGTFKNQFNYPENVMSWLTYMGIDHSQPLQHIFKNEHYSTYNLMVALKALFEDIRALNHGRRGGDKIVISNKNGHPVHITATGSFAVDERTKAETFIRLLGERTGWQYHPELWTWDNLVVHTFTKASTLPTLGRYNTLMAQHPLSLAITSSTTIEYTLDTNNLFRQ